MSQSSSNAAGVLLETSYYPVVKPEEVTGETLEEHNALGPNLRECVPYLRNVLVTQEKMIYKPPSVLQLRNAVAVAVKALAESYDQLPSVSLSYETGPFARNFRERCIVDEESRIGYLTYPDPIDWDIVASEVMAREPDPEEAFWEEEFWKAVSISRVQQKKNRDLERLNRRSKQQKRALSRASISSVAGTLPHSLTATPMSRLHSMNSLCTPPDTDTADSPHARRRVEGLLSSTGGGTDSSSRRPLSSAQRNAKGFLRRAKFNEARLVAPGPGQPSPVQRAGTNASAHRSLNPDHGFRFPVPSLTSDASNWPDFNSTRESCDMPSLLADSTTPLTPHGCSPRHPSVVSEAKSNRNTTTASTYTSVPLPVADAKPRAAPAPIAPSRPLQREKRECSNGPTESEVSNPSSLQRKTSSSVLVMAPEPVPLDGGRKGNSPSPKVAPPLAPTTAAPTPTRPAPVPAASRRKSLDGANTDAAPSSRCRRPSPVAPADSSPPAKAPRSSAAGKTERSSLDQNSISASSPPQRARSETARPLEFPNVVVTRRTECSKSQPLNGAAIHGGDGADGPTHQQQQQQEQQEQQRAVSPRRAVSDQAAGTSAPPLSSPAIPSTRDCERESAATATATPEKDYNTSADTMEKQNSLLQSGSPPSVAKSGGNVKCNTRRNSIVSNTSRQSMKNNTKCCSVM